jgi:hypothetical protein
MNDIQENSLYGSSEHEDLVKKRISAELIKSGKVLPGEEHLDIQKSAFGSIIITTKEIGTRICNEFNEKQKKHISEKTFSHKFLCERRDEASALLFLTLRDLIGNNFVDEYKQKREEICEYIAHNIKGIVKQRLPWLVEFSTNILLDYYGLSANRLKIKSNYILDDEDYDESQLGKVTKGGLILNGLLDELDFYEKKLPTKCIGFICQILSPSGLPRNRKWAQIDAGITSIGKREYKKDLLESAIENLHKTTNIILHADMTNCHNTVYYSSLPDGSGYEGYTIFIWEAFYDDVLYLEDIPINKSFCKCAQRNSIICEKKLSRSKINSIKKLN